MKKRLLQILQLTLTIALVFFIAIKGREFLHDIDWNLVGEKTPFMLLAGILFLVGYTIMSYHWLKVCRIIEPDTPKRQRLAYFASQPYKYLPTSLFTLSFRAKFSKQLGMGLRHSSQAQVIENLNLVGSALFCGIVLLGALLYPAISFISLLILCGVLLSIPKTIKLQVPKIKHDLNVRELIVCFFTALSGWVVIGLGFFVMGASFEQNFSLPLAIASNSFATGLGMLAVFAPGGIGVRELVFSFFGYVSSTIIAWRFVTFIIDIGVGVWSMWMIRRGRSQSS